MRLSLAAVCTLKCFSLFPLSDVDRDEHLIVTAPVEDQDILLSHGMGQDEPAVPVAAPLEVNMQTLEAEQMEHLPQTLSAPDSSSPEVYKCTAPSQPFSPVLDTHYVPIPPLAPTSVSSPEADSVPSCELEDFSLTEPHEEKRLAEPECSGLPDRSDSTQNSKLPPLNINTSLEGPAPSNEEQELPLPKATYNFDPDQLDDTFNPFTSGGSKIQNSPPPCATSSFSRLEPIGSSLPVCESSSAAPAEADMMASSTEAKPVLLEFGLDEGPISKPPPRKLTGKKTGSKLTAKRQKPKVSEDSCKPAPEATDSQPVSETQQEPEAVAQSLEPDPETSDSCGPLNLDDVPIPKTGTYNFDPSQWDDPNFNPFGSNSKTSSSPELPKGSYSSDDSVDPFKPSKSLSTEEESSTSAAQPVKKVKDGNKAKAGQRPEEKKVRQIPRKGKERTVS